jgi:(p)ppGpp synthase/HD superfamily hydrolase
MRTYCLLTSAMAFAMDIHHGVKRKGKDTPYITHPLAVALILARVSDSDDLIAAGILHDTIEDCEPYGSVTREMFADKFGERIAELVVAVTQDKTLPRAVRKQHATEHLIEMDYDMLLLKTADMLHNLSELIEDVEESGNAAFKIFKGGKQMKVQEYTERIAILDEVWLENPLLGELREGFSKIMLLLEE